MIDCYLNHHQNVFEPCSTLNGFEQEEFSLSQTEQTSRFVLSEDLQNGKNSYHTGKNTTICLSSLSEEISTNGVEKNIDYNNDKELWDSILGSQPSFLPSADLSGNSSERQEPRISEKRKRWSRKDDIQL